MKTKILSIIMLLFISFGIPNVKAQNNENNAFNKEYTNIDDFVLNLLTEDTSIELKLNRNLPVYIGKGQVLNFHFTPLLFQSRTNHQIQFYSIFFKITRKSSKLLRGLRSVRPLFTIQTPVFKNVCIPGINQIYGLNPWYYGILPNPLF